jgi:predicted TIM-barrel fold metal-dependent hydrolase
MTDRIEIVDAQVHLNQLVPDWQFILNHCGSINVSVDRRVTSFL